MKKVLATIIFAILVLTMILSLTGCGGASLEGRWEQEKYGQVAYYIEFRSDGTCVYGSGAQGTGASGNGTYKIDGDGTLHINGFSSSESAYTKTTIDEIRKMSYSEASNYYAFDDSSAYFWNNEEEFKRK